jgi:hypothetical protein
MPEPKDIWHISNYCYLYGTMCTKKRVAAFGQAFTLILMITYYKEEQYEQCHSTVS